MVKSTMSTPGHYSKSLFIHYLLWDQVFICFVLFGLNAESKQVLGGYVKSEMFIYVYYSFFNFFSPSLAVRNWFLYFRQPGPNKYTREISDIFIKHIESCFFKLLPRELLLTCQIYLYNATSLCRN